MIGIWRSLGDISRDNFPVGIAGFQNQRRVNRHRVRPVRSVHPESVRFYCQNAAGFLCIRQGISRRVGEISRRVNQVGRGDKINNSIVFIQQIDRPILLQFRR